MKLMPLNLKRRYAIISIFFAQAYPNKKKSVKKINLLWAQKVIYYTN